MAEKTRLGVLCTFSINTNWNQAAATGFDAPTWSTVGVIEDLMLDEDWLSGQGGDRAQGMEASAKTRAKCEITGRAREDETDANYQRLLAAFRSRTAEIDVMVLDGARTSNGAVGVRGLFQLHRFAQKQGPDDVLYRDMILRPAIISPGSATPFQSVLVTTGVPVFTTAYAIS